jgi:hypothetical protein
MRFKSQKSIKIQDTYSSAIIEIYVPDSDCKGWILKMEK